MDRVVVDGDTIAVSAPVMDIDAQSDQGAVFVYERDDAGAWNEVAMLVASDGIANDELGRTLAVSGDVLVAAAPAAMRDGQSQRGAVYVFVRDDAGGWSEVQSLVPADADDWDNLGSGLAIDDEGRIIVGASGAAPPDVAPPGFANHDGAVYVFEPQPDGTWTEGQKFYASDTQTGWRFGSELVVDGDTLAVAAANANGNGAMWTGAMYVFERDANGLFTDEVKLGAGTTQNSAFGGALGLAGDHLVVGASQQNVGSGNAGSAFVFTRDAAGVWGEAQHLIEPGFEAGNEFGRAVGAGGGAVLVGAGASEEGDAHGAAYVYAPDPAGTFIEIEELQSPADTDFFFARGLGFDGSTLAVRSLTGGGTVWIYEAVAGPTTCASDADCKSGLCEADGLCCESACGGDDDDDDDAGDSGTEGGSTDGGVLDGGDDDSTTSSAPSDDGSTEDGPSDDGPADDTGPDSTESTTGGTPEPSEGTTTSGGDDSSGGDGAAADDAADGCACQASPQERAPAWMLGVGLVLIAARRRKTIR